MVLIYFPFFYSFLSPSNHGYPSSPLGELCASLVHGRDPSSRAIDCVEGVIHIRRRQGALKPAIGLEIGLYALWTPDETCLRSAQVSRRSRIEIE